MKELFQGLGVAVVAGLLMGAAMKPDLRAPGDASGPQMFAGIAGHRASPYESDANWLSYNGVAPDYVIGTDALKPSRWLEASLDDSASERTYYEAREQEVAYYTRAAYQPDPAPAEAPPAPPAYASLVGDIMQGIGAPPPQAPPTDDAPAPAPAPAAVDASATAPADTPTAPAA